MELIYALQSVASPALDRVMLLITELGSEMVYIALLVFTFAAIDARRGRLIAVYFLAGYYVNQLLKGLFSTQRPFEIDPEVARSQQAIETTRSTAGFPSGHAQSTTTFWGLAAGYVRRTWFTLVALLIVLLVSLSRLYLGLHLPIDIIGGLAVGLIVILGAGMVERSSLRLGAPVIVILGLALPLTLHLLLPTQDSGMLLGSLAAFMIGPEFIRHETSGPLTGRIVLGLIALALVAGALMASSALLSEALKEDRFVSFARYLVIGLVGTVLVPALGRAFRLTPRRVGPFARK